MIARPAAPGAKAPSCCLVQEKHLSGALWDRLPVSLLITTPTNTLDCSDWEFSCLYCNLNEREGMLPQSFATLHTCTAGRLDEGARAFWRLLSRCNKHSKCWIWQMKAGCMHFSQGNACQISNCCRQRSIGCTSVMHLTLSTWTSSTASQSGDRLSSAFLHCSHLYKRAPGRLWRQLQSGCISR